MSQESIKQIETIENNLNNDANKSLENIENKGITSEEFQEKRKDFEMKNNESLSKIREVRTSLGLPENDSATAEIVARNDKLKKMEEEINVKHDNTDIGLNDDLIEKDEKIISKQQTESKPKIDNKEKTAGSVEEQEKQEEKEELEPGDEIFKYGKFYKIIDISNSSGLDEKEIHEEYIRKKQMGAIPYDGQTEFEYKLEKEKQLKDGGLLVPSRKIRAILEGEIGSEDGSDYRNEKERGRVIELDESDVFKVKTPEQRKKLEKMQKEINDDEQATANFTGYGALNKVVNKITRKQGA